MVAWKQAKRAFNIYRFDNKVAFNREGLYLHLTNIHDVTRFLSNLNLVNDRLEKDSGVRTTAHILDSSSVILCIPNKVWKTTYYVSVLTMLIRVCNYSCLYEGWDDIFSDVSPMTTLDGAFPAKTRNYVAKNGFKLPTKFRKFWYNGSFGWNSESNPNAPSNIIHNNGAVDWVSNMEVV